MTRTVGSAVFKPSPMASGEGGFTTSKCSHLPLMLARGRRPGRLSGRRQNESEFAAHAGDRNHGDITGMAGRDLLAQEKAQARPRDGHVLIGRQATEPRE